MSSLSLVFFSSVDYKNQKGFNTGSSAICILWHPYSGIERCPQIKNTLSYTQHKSLQEKYLIKNDNSFLIGKLYSWEKMVPLMAE